MYDRWDHVSTTSLHSLLFLHPSFVLSNAPHPLLLLLIWAEDALRRSRSSKKRTSMIHLKLFSCTSQPQPWKLNSSREQRWYKETPKWFSQTSHTINNPVNNPLHSLFPRSTLLYNHLTFVHLTVGCKWQSFFVALDQCIDQMGVVPSLSEVYKKHDQTHLSIRKERS